MMRYALPMVPAQISFWVINASDLFFVQAMCEGYQGQSGEYWTGLLGVGYFLPTILTVLGTIFYEAWQLSAVTEEKGRAAFFSRVFGIYQALLFCCCSGIILLCRPMMFMFKSNFYDAWQFVPMLTLATLFNCFNQFLNSVYMVEKRSTLSLYTMLAGAIANCALNWALIPLMGPNGATLASLISYVIVFVLRAINTRGLIHMSFAPLRLTINCVLIGVETVLMAPDSGLAGLVHPAHRGDLPVQPAGHSGHAAPAAAPPRPPQAGITSHRTTNKNRPRGHVFFTQARGRYFLWLVQSGMASWVRRM